MIPSAEEQVRFLQNVQRILEEGSFVATYKFALLIALADIAVESGDDSGDPLDLPLRAISERFVELYYRQARPFHSTKSSSTQVLQQNTGRQATIVTYVGQHLHTTLAQLRHDRKQWDRLVRSTEATIVNQPLWKLQVVGGTRLTFLYDHPNPSGIVGGKEARTPVAITLKPGVALCLRRFHGLVRELASSAWVRFVRQMPANRPVLGQTTELAEFMFGSERANLDRCRPVLNDVQHGSCFYCSKRLQPRSDVDHFIPWVRYPVDLGHNFVPAHSSCNNQKHDRLAGMRHLERWLRRSDDHGTEFAERFTELKIAHDWKTSERIAHWAYGQAAAAEAFVWDRSDVLGPLPPDWEGVFQSAAGGEWTGFQDFQD